MNCSDRRDVLVDLIEDAHPLADWFARTYEILDAVPDGWAKIDGVWVQLEVVSDRRTAGTSVWRQGSYVGEEPIYGRTV